jgi:hypothetical protein
MYTQTTWESWYIPLPAMRLLPLAGKPTMTTHIFESSDYEAAGKHRKVKGSARYAVTEL